MKWFYEYKSATKWRILSARKREDMLRAGDMSVLNMEISDRFTDAKKYILYKINEQIKECREAADELRSRSKQYFY